MLEELDRVRTYRVDEPVAGDVTVEAARAQLMRAIAGDPRRSPQRVPLARRQRRRRMVLAAGVAGIAVLVAGVVGFHTAAAPQSALAKDMDQLASVAASQDWTGIPGPGQYLYTESDSSYQTEAGSESCLISYRDHRQSWIATDGSGALDDAASGFAFTSAADKVQCATTGITDPSSTLGHGAGVRYPAGALTFPTNDWKSLSTDPKTLLTQVHEDDGGPDTPADSFTNVADFLRESDVPPVIRAALYQATALIPGVQSLGAATTHDGQTGLGVAFYADGRPTHELVFDQQTGRMLGEMYYDGGGNLTAWGDYLDQKVVGTMPDYPMTTLKTVLHTQGASAPAATGTTTTGG